MEEKNNIKKIISTEEKTDTKKIIEEQRLTRMQIAQMISEQQKTKKETRRWGIVISILLIIPILIMVYPYIRMMFGP